MDGLILKISWLLLHTKFNLLVIDHEGCIKLKTIISLSYKFMSFIKLVNSNVRLVAILNHR